MFLRGAILGIFYGVYWNLLPARLRRRAFTLVAGGMLVTYAPYSVGVLATLTLGVHAFLAPGESVSRSRSLLALGLGVGALLVQKYTPVFHEIGRTLPPSLTHAGDAGAAITILGLSYASFRLIHVALDRSKERLELRGPLELLEYTLFPPTFLSGPIERLQNFREGTDLEALDEVARFGALFRITTGLFKKVFLVQPLMLVADPVFAQGAAPSAFLAWKGLLSYGLVLYLDFSAYCDIALGVSRLFGFRISENFRWPYLATDIGDFWRRWHISLSEWLRDYVYLPTSLWLTHWRPLKRRFLTVAMGSSLVTMFVCGLWHGTGAGFVIWGLGHGVLLALHQAYRTIVLGRLKARKRKTLQKNPAYRFAGWLLTFTLVNLLWVPFRLPPAETIEFLGSLVP